ncbi:hypothetical protein Q8A73_012803 [Channa argus]|nr:hypothetical protein Q8A73_012803 [Channa argus]
MDADCKLLGVENKKSRSVVQKLRARLTLRSRSCVGGTAAEIDADCTSQSPDRFVWFWIQLRFILQSVRHRSVVQKLRARFNSDAKKIRLDGPVKDDGPGSCCRPPADGNCEAAVSCSCVSQDVHQGEQHSNITLTWIFPVSAVRSTDSLIVDIMDVKHMRRIYNYNSETETELYPHELYRGRRPLILLFRRIQSLQAEEGSVFSLLLDCC